MKMLFKLLLRMLLIVAGLYFIFWVGIWKLGICGLLMLLSSEFLQGGVRLFFFWTPITLGILMLYGAGFIKNNGEG